jgi:autotransporter-associated beta strand protein
LADHHECRGRKLYLHEPAVRLVPQYFTWNSWIGHSFLYFNNGTIQPYGTGLYLQNNMSFMNYNGAGTEDMQFATWNPFTIVPATNGTHTFDSAMATGGAADIIISPSAQIVDSSNGPGSIVKEGVANLVFTGDGPYATNSFSGTTTVNGGLLLAQFNMLAGRPASSTGTNVLLDAFGPNSRVIFNGGNFDLRSRPTGPATTFTGKTLTPFGIDLISVGGNTLAAGQVVNNPNLPPGTYIRQRLSNRYLTLSHAMTNPGSSFTGQTIQFQPATFVCTQHLAAVTLQKDANVKCSANLGPATLVCGPLDGTGEHLQRCNPHRPGQGISWAEFLDVQLAEHYLEQQPGAGWHRLQRRHRGGGQPDPLGRGPCQRRGHHWPGSYPGWYAQSNAVSLMDCNCWWDIPGSQTATNLSITVDPAQPVVFYRMRKP